MVFVEEFYLDSYIVDSIENGLIHENIINSLRNKAIFVDNECLYKLRNSLLKYIKAYLVYVICGYVQNTDSTLEKHDSLANSMSPTYIRNYIQLRNYQQAVYTEISILFDILKNASLSDDDLRIIFIMNKINYMNIKAYTNSPRYSELSKYDSLLLKVIDDSGLGVFNMSKKDLVDLSKCYILSKQDLSDSEFLCGSSSFIYNIVNDAYSLFEGYSKSFTEIINDRDADIEKVIILRKIIKMNNFNNR